MDSDNPQLNPATLTVEQAARLLCAVSTKAVSSDKLQKDVEDGAPTNEDGTINLVHYAAWLVKEMGRGD